MTMNSDDDQPTTEDNWSRLLGAARKTGGTTPEPPPAEPPASIWKRFPEWRENVLAVARTLLWRRWSWITAVLALLVFLLVWFLLRTDPDPIIEPPVLFPKL
jgi:hypothetical protein